MHPVPLAAFIYSKKTDEQIPPFTLLSYGGHQTGNAEVTSPGEKPVAAVHTSIHVTQRELMLSHADATNCVTALMNLGSKSTV